MAIQRENRAKHRQRRDLIQNLKNKTTLSHHIHRCTTALRYQAQTKKYLNKRRNELRSTTFLHCHCQAATQLRNRNAFNTTNRQPPTATTTTSIASDHSDITSIFHYQRQ
ncbi:unnamed protein product [Ceratitis capitata]|uniref:(Mediterranean fruit fly) hypothetical protein n=1 Tax=Ceratitis capitata TaxID=7213 RepID=A0A811VK17_CERCA|nr:unnamed protein product [Ceratitis capitata]